MAEIVKLERKPEWQASFSLYRDSDGQLVVVLEDARVQLVERPMSSRDNLLTFADQIEAGLDRMRENAKLLGDA